MRIQKAISAVCLWIVTIYYISDRHIKSVVTLAMKKSSTLRKDRDTELSLVFPVFLSAYVLEFFVCFGYQFFVEYRHGRYLLI